MRRRIDTTRAAQILFLLLLSTSGVMVAWWLMDQTAFVASVSSRILGLYEEELAAGRMELAKGAGVGEVTTRFPHLEAVNGELQVSRRALAELEEERRSHLNQYLWEGAFFLLVLMAGMAVLWRALSQEALLRRRQENFLAAVTHELKTPLASLQLATETMALRNPGPEKRQQLLSRCLEDLERLEAMVANLLEASRLDDRAEQAREPLSLAAAVDRALAELGSLAAETEVDLRVPPGLTLLADPSALGAVLRNLLSNAVKATNASATRRVTVEAEEDGSTVLLRVRDNGVGFAREESERLFEKFYRPGDELCRRSSGTGLGLYLVRRLVELDGGSVAASSEGPGKGAVFTVSWPVEG